MRETIMAQRATKIMMCTDDPFGCELCGIDGNAVTYIVFQDMTARGDIHVSYCLPCFDQIWERTLAARTKFGHASPVIRLLLRFASYARLLAPTDSVAKFVKGELGK